MASAEKLIHVFNEAKARPTQAERQHFVSEACAHDPELKQQVLSLLEAHDRAAEFLQPAADLKIGLIGDYYPKITAHRAIVRSFEIAGLRMNERRLAPTWLGTDTLEKMCDAELQEFSGFWCVPGSPYASETGALRGIQFARENCVPFLGTCAGFQHALLEYARNVLKIEGAGHGETNPDAACVVITRLACPLVEKEAEVFLQESSRLRAACGSPTSIEQYHCNFGPAPTCQALFANGTLSFSARGHDGKIHALELVAHPFYIATLFQPERAALRGAVHPLVGAFFDAAASAVAAREIRAESCVESPPLPDLRY